MQIKTKEIIIKSIRVKKKPMPYNKIFLRSNKLENLDDVKSTAEQMQRYISIL